MERRQSPRRESGRIAALHPCRSGRARFTAIALALLPAFAAPPALALIPSIGDGPSPAAAPLSQERDLCDYIEASARNHGLPVSFFTRLLWKESRFRRDALSPKGAQGIAQFMPGTASDRGLADPFDPLEAIPASAKYLQDLRAQFGNLGLAAAAYNAGPARVSSFLAGGTLPYETQDFVVSITGEPADTWASPELAAKASAAPPEDDDCQQLAARLKDRGLPPSGKPLATAHGPWGVQVAGNFTQAKALATYRMLQKRYPAILGGKTPMVLRPLVGRGRIKYYQIRVPAETRESANKLCDRLRAAGGPCIVLKT